MAKTKIHTHEDALSVYFADMLSASFRSVTPTDTPPSAKIDTDMVVANVEHEPPPAPEIVPATSKYLLCEAAGLAIAIELLSLNTIIPWPQTGLMAVPGQPDMVLGLLNHRSQQTLVLNPSLLLNSKPVTEKPQYHYLLLFDDRRHAIACEHIDQILTLEPERIHWQKRTQQSWHKGTVLEHLHSIVDLPVLLQQLLQEE